MEIRLTNESGEDFQRRIQDKIIGLRHTFESRSSRFDRECLTLWPAVLLRFDAARPKLFVDGRSKPGNGRQAPAQLGGEFKQCRRCRGRCWGAPRSVVAHGGSFGTRCIEGEGVEGDCQWDDLACAKWTSVVKRRGQVPRDG